MTAHVPTYPFVKVTLAVNAGSRVFANGGVTATQREDDPDTAKLLARGWSVIDRWEVLETGSTRRLPVDGESPDAFAARVIRAANVTAQFSPRKAPEVQP